MLYTFAKLDHLDVQAASATDAFYRQGDVKGKDGAYDSEGEGIHSGNCSFRKRVDTL